MPKTFDLKTVTAPVLLYLLQEEFRFPRLFMWQCVRTLNTFKAGIDARFPSELVDLAATPLWLYINLKRELGQPKAFEIVRVALLTGGIAQWNLQYDTIHKARTFANLCEQEILVNKTGITRWNTMEIGERSDHRFELKITRCLYHELAVSVGVPEITPLVCQLDNAGFNSYLPDQVRFHRGGPGHRIADGSPACRFIWEVEAAS